jgi:hypothetical protein
MPRYKVLKGVAHNIGHLFTSLMNYAVDDYVKGHILRFARISGKQMLTIDFVAETAGPEELLASPISEVLGRYTNWHSSIGGQPMERNQRSGDNLQNDYT